MAESEEELKSLLMKVKEESEKAGLHIQKTKIVASDPKLWESVKDREAWRAAVYKVTKNQTRLTEQQWEIRKRN